MWTKTTSILLLVLLINFTSGLERWHKSKGVVNSACPLDDDPDDPTHLPVDGDCTKFIKCSYGLAYTLSCPSGLHWANSLSQCESPKIANCNSTETETETENTKECDYTFKPHPTDCHKGLQCFNGVEMEVECPEGSSWDKMYNKCSFIDPVC